MSVNQRAKSPITPSIMSHPDENLFDRKFTPYLYWPPALIMVLLAAGSYLAGMYVAA